MTRHEMSDFDTDKHMTGATAGTRCAPLADIADGDPVFLELPDHPEVKVCVRLVERQVFDGMLVMSASTMAKLTEAAGGPVAAVTVRALTRAERARRKITAKHAAVVLTLLAAAAAFVIAFWPTSSGTAGDRLGTTVGWESGRVLSAADVRTVAEARRAAAQPDPALPWLKAAGAGAALAAAIAAFVVAWRAAES